MAPVTPLGQLIEDVRAAFLAAEGTVLSYDVIAARGGGVITGGRIQQLATGPLNRLPSPETLEALALGLRVPYTTVLDVALASTGHLGELPTAARKRKP